MHEGHHSHAGCPAQELPFTVVGLEGWVISLLLEMVKGAPEVHKGQGPPIFCLFDVADHPTSTGHQRLGGKVLNKRTSQKSGLSGTRSFRTF